MNITSSSTLECRHNNKERKSRAIVVCFDHMRKFTRSKSNALKLFGLLPKGRRGDDEGQVRCHHPCEGTGVRWGTLQPITRWVDPILDRAFAVYLSAHVKEGYKFLMKHYNVGDKICLFGSSHGAYIARALASMVHKVGLLPKDSPEVEIARAYDMYVSTFPSNVAHAWEFKSTTSRNVIIDFVGVWDTISSVGLLMSRSLPILEPANIRVFRHALSLDEHRTRFCPNLYHTIPPSKTPIAMPGMDVFETDVKEVWFAGHHSDVTGGATLDTTENALSNLSLRWMVEEVMKSDCNIQFDFNAFDKYHIPRSTGNESDQLDAIQGTKDDLWRSPLWWPLEFLPLLYTYQDEKGKWVNSWWPNFGRRRWIPPGPLFHPSVKIRMDDPELKYKPRAYYEKGTEVYVS